MYGDNHTFIRNAIEVGLQKNAANFVIRVPFIQFILFDITCTLSNLTIFKDIPDHIF